MRRPTTRHHHIDTQVTRVEPCYTCRKHGNPRATHVIFTNDIVVCSSAHVHGGDYEDIPALRISEYDPGEWIKTHSADIARQINVELCPPHEDGSDEVAENWGYDGHLWLKHNIQELTLCLPLTKYQGGPA